MKKGPKIFKSVTESQNNNYNSENDIKIILSPSNLFYYLILFKFNINILDTLFFIFLKVKR
jgi:hypothetical protein